MPQSPPADRFLHALASAVLRAADPAALAAEGSAALGDVLQERPSLAFEVQFTGFMARGERLGGVNPDLLRAAGQLIILRVNKMGFTRDCSEGDLRALFEALATPAAELQAVGVVSRLEESAPAGILVGTSTGEVYRPPAGKKAARADAGPADESAPVASAPAGGGGAMAGEEQEEVEFSDFELLDLQQQIDSIPETRAAGEASRPVEAAAEAEEETGGLFNFFRASGTGAGGTADLAALAERIRREQDLNRFTELLHTISTEVSRALSAGDPAAVQLLHALKSESKRTDRTRIFREAAAQTLREVGRGTTLQRLVTLAETRREGRSELVQVIVTLGDEAVALLETLFFRAGDAELREILFRELMHLEGWGDRMIERALLDPQPNRARAVLELVAGPGIPRKVGHQWVERMAKHYDAAVRTDTARAAAAIGGRPSVRVLIDLLSDPEREVRRAAVQGLGVIGDSAAVPFLARLLTDGADEELQQETIHALGRIGSGEALPPLLGVLNRRQLLGARKLLRLKLVAIAAIGNIPTRAAHETLVSTAEGKEQELATEARRVLAGRAQTDLQ